MKMLSRLAGAAATLALVGVSQAAVVTYNESIGGDLPVFGTPLPTFTFDIGTNTISGNTGFLDSGSDGDSFAFIVPVGAEVVAAQVQMTDSVGDLGSAVWGLFSGSLDFRGGASLENIRVPSPGISAFASGGLGAGSYNISAQSVTGTIGLNTGDYTFSFTLRPVNQVPVPTTLVLIAIAGMAAAWACRPARSAW